MIHRRAFLIASAGGVVAGCGDRQREEQNRFDEALNARQQRLESLDQYFVPPEATRTTPEPSLNVAEVFPELKPLGKVTVRLHPRLIESDTLSAGLMKPADFNTASRVGGPFAGPEPARSGPGRWIPVIQLRAEHAPPKLRFEPNTDLLQLYWYPAADPAQPPDLLVAFHDRRKLGDTGNAIMLGGDTNVPFAWLPFPCIVFPERVFEYPSPTLMPRIMRERLAAWTPPVAGQSGTDYFFDQLGPAPGTKVGGWPRSSGEPRTPVCPSCRRMMDYLLTVDSTEWDDRTASRWQPTEEREFSANDGFRTAIGLDFGPGRRAVQVYLCDRCPDRPAAAEYA